MYEQERQRLMQRAAAAEHPRDEEQPEEREGHWRDGMPQNRLRDPAVRREMR